MVFSARIRIPFDKKNLMSNVNQFEFHDHTATSLSDMVFGFLEDGDSSSGSTSSEGCHENKILDMEEEENNGNVEENRSFWESQHQLLHATLCRTSSLESSIRSITKEALKERQTAGNCGCGRPMAAGCRSCLMAEISSRLRNAGHNSSICKTKWRSSPDIPAGEHTFMDVIDSSISKRGEVRVIIELNFREAFEMAKASEEYNQLAHKLPEVFVGKVERLNSVIKILCLAAKKCMKEKKMHLGPWRKQRYMQAKWLAKTCERATSMPPLSTAHSGRLLRPQTSMLTVDLKEMLPDVHCTAVAAVW
ncbi:hypothetical protein SADUNF_Sadunf11G0032700 [Salix dunnii]|uniref:Uncharacterized protein n=1 Tax=Salix dunnii TaxID=1413687 RepID=A0A835MMS9_9ROSI|nr:hypothetical protein SADUNF_Sadunf11G0032700 [Salix dunnii]